MADSTEEQKPESAFLTGLFHALAASKIQYAVMRNHEPLPHSAGGSDLDILISPDEVEQVRRVVFSAIHAAGGIAIGVAESVRFFKVYALGQSPEATGAWWGLRVDINVGLYFRGLRLLDEARICPTKLHNGIPVLEDGFAGVLGVLKDVLNNSVLPASYLPTARQMAIAEWPRVETLLAPMGSTALARFHRLLLSDDRSASLKEDCQRLRHDIFSHARSRRPVGAWLSRAAYEWSKLRRYLRPSGVVVAILGVDGAGKSTLINALLSILNAATHNATVVRHLRPTVLPPLGRLKGKKPVSDGLVLEPHGSTPSGWLGSLVRLAYLTADYILGYWIWTRPRIAKQPTVVIFDRYAYDMALDPRRFRIGLPAWVARGFAALIPKPDIIFCLHGDPAVIATRKHELSKEETRRQVDALRAFAAHEHRAVLIATDTSVEETRDQVLLALMRFIKARHQVQA